VIEIAETLLRSDVPVVVANALFAMYCQGPVASVSRPILRLGASSDKHIARNTALLLGSSADDSPAVKRALRKLAEYEEPSVRYWAVDALATRAKGDRKTIALLRKRAEDSERDVRGKALYGLAIAGHPEAAQLITGELRRGQFDEAVVSAAELLKGQGLVALLEHALRRRRVRDLMGDEIERAIQSMRNGQ
jgi:HEAT repeat protein